MQAPADVDGAATATALGVAGVGDAVEVAIEDAAATAAFVQAGAVVSAAGPGADTGEVVAAVEVGEHFVRATVGPEVFPAGPGRRRRI